MYWIYVTPTVHALLGHSAELISFNKNKGLKYYSEEGLETYNKLLRFYRRTLSRKPSKQCNLEDCFTRLWLKSDPIIRHAFKHKNCSYCDSAVHSSWKCPQKLSFKEGIALCQDKESYYYNFLLSN